MSQPAVRVLLLGKAEQIQRYLLASPRLHQIRGGSYLLVQLERETRRIVENCGGKTLCAAGGILTASFADQFDADRALSKVRSLYSLRAPGLRFRAATDAENGLDFGEHIRRARQHLAQVPDATMPPADIPFLLPCDVCGRPPARLTLSRPDNPRACIECWARDQADRAFEVELGQAEKAREQGRLPDGILPRVGLELELHDRGAAVPVRDDGPKRRRARRIEDVAIGRPPGYVGYVAADGNGIGARLARLGEQGGDPETSYEAFSAILDEATRTALIEAVAECRQRYASSERPGLAENPPLQVLPVVAGGDDLLVLCPPAAAVPLAVAFARAFEAATERADPLSTGVGVVIAHASTPFGSLDEHAHEAQRAAKRLSRRSAEQGKRIPSAIGFRVLRGGPSTGPEEVRRNRFAGIDAYLVEDPECSLDAKRLLEAAWQLAESRPAWSRLKRIDDILRRYDDDRASDELEIVLGPLDEEQRKALRAGAAPPRDHSGTGVWLSRSSSNGDRGDVRATPLPDLLALAELL